jgi:hypothetical protein
MVFSLVSSSSASATATLVVPHERAKTMPKLISAKSRA